MCEGAAAAVKAAERSGSPKRNLSECMKAPLRVLRRVRDMYVRSLGDCAGAGGGGGRGAPMSGFTAGVVVMMPRARSRSAFGQSDRFGSGDDDFRDLVRASSKQGSPHEPVSAVPRSQSLAAAIGRIDEDTPCEFDVDMKFGIGGAAYPRSRSCAMGPTGRMDRRVIA